MSEKRQELQDLGELTPEQRHNLAIVNSRCRRGIDDETREELAAHDVPPCTKAVGAYRE